MFVSPHSSTYYMDTEEKGLVLVGEMIGTYCGWQGMPCQTPIPIPREGLPIQQLQAGEGFALLLDVDGNLEACGCPQGRPILPQFKRILKSTKIKQFSCGSYHWYAVTMDGKLIGDMTSDDAQLQLLETVSTKEHPRKIPQLPPVRLISCSKAFTVVEDEEGKIWGWGRSKFGQLGVTQDEIVKPRIIPMNSHSTGLLQDITTSSCSTILMDSSGTVWIAGSQENKSPEFTKVEMEAAIVQVVAGSRVIMCLDTRGCIWNCTDAKATKLELMGEGNAKLAAWYNSFAAITKDGVGTWFDPKGKALSQVGIESHGEDLQPVTIRCTSFPRTHSGPKSATK